MHPLPWHGQWWVARKLTFKGWDRINLWAKPLQRSAFISLSQVPLAVLLFLYVSPLLVPCLNTDSSAAERLCCSCLFLNMFSPNRVLKDFPLISKLEKWKPSDYDVNKVMGGKKANMEFHSKLNCHSQKSVTCRFVKGAF